MYSHCLLPFKRFGIFLRVLMWIWNDWLSQYFYPTHTQSVSLHDILCPKVLENP